MADQSVTRRLVARKFDGSKQRRYPGRPRVERESRDLEAFLEQSANVPTAADRT